MRAFRALLLLELLDRLIFANPEKRLRKLREQLREKEVEVEALNRKIVELESKVAMWKEAKAKKTASSDP